MEDHLETGASRTLDRPGYAKRSLACLVGYGLQGMVIGAVLASPTGGVQLFSAVLIVGNIILGSLFVSFTYRRALDCKFGQNGRAWIAALAAIPTLAMPNLIFVVFLVMMLIKSAPDEEEELDFQDDEFPLPPLQSGE